MQQMSSDTKLNNIAAERGVLSYILNTGSQAVAEIAGSLCARDFSVSIHQSIFDCAVSACEESDIDSVLNNSILSSAKEKGLIAVFDKDSIDYVEKVRSSDFNSSEINSFVKKIKFWSVVKNLKSNLSDNEKLLDNLSGEESILDVISSAEESVFSFLPELVDGEEIVDLSSFASEHINYIAENPVTLAGIPSGYPKYDQAIGGGFRRGTVNVVGARPKVGKSTFCLNVVKNVSSNNMPVLYLDTEMKKETQAIKLVSLVSKVPQSKIETGEFTQKENLSIAVSESLEYLKNTPVDHVSVAGKKPQEIMSIVRRWLNKRVGKNINGTTKDCLVVLDYLKMMDLGDLGSNQEYQYLGDFITKLHNFAVKYDVPILSTVQLNRDGINREDGAVVSGSDRILWLCSSLAYIKKKTDEDVAAGDSKSNGDRKIIVIDTRYGSGMDASCEYVNLICNLDRCDMVEGKYNYEIIDDQNSLGDTNDYESDSIEF